MLLLRIFLLTVALLIASCSSNSYFANRASDSLGTLSPVGSRLIQRHQQMVFSPYYRLYVAYSIGGIQADEADLNHVSTTMLAEQLKQHYAWVVAGNSPMTLEAAMQDAAKQGAQIMLLPRIENWPDIEPIRIHECETKDGKVTPSFSECNEKGDTPKASDSSDELIQNIAIYDVLSGMQVDSITATSRQGLGSYVFERGKEELKALNQLVVNKLSPRSSEY